MRVRSNQALNLMIARCKEKWNNSTLTALGLNWTKCSANLLREFMRSQAQRKCRESLRRRTEKRRGKKK